MPKTPILVQERADHIFIPRKKRGCWKKIDS